MNGKMKAFLVNNPEDGFVRGTLMVDKPVPNAGEVLVKVHWSSVNYKDGLASIPNGKVVRNYPRIPGIDLAGVVVDSNKTKIREGTHVLAHGLELGISRDGGFAEYCAVPEAWLIQLPGLAQVKHAMIAGTAGFTAAKSVIAISENKVVPNDGPVLVTGATGGVGSFAVALLSSLGYQVTASTGRSERKEWLKSLGASEVIERLPETSKPLEKETWVAAVDTVGGSTLSAVLASTKYSGIVTSCGNTGGVELNTTVFPFILRGVSLIGIDSVNVNMQIRTDTWAWLFRHLEESHWDSLCGRTESLDNLSDSLDEVLAGNALGRTIISIGK